MSQSAATADPNAIATTNDAPSQPENADVVVQYVVLRRDLIDTWPLGSVVTQGCHASVSAVWSNKEDPFTVDYCSPDKIDSMHKLTKLDGWSMLASTKNLIRWKLVLEIIHRNLLIGIKKGSTVAIAAATSRFLAFWGFCDHN